MSALRGLIGLRECVDVVFFFLSLLLNGMHLFGVL
jgi:hypothetical protein